LSINAIVHKRHCPGYSWWATEALFDKGTDPYRQIMSVESISSCIFGYKVDQFGLDILMILVLGLAYRAVSLGLMLVLQRDKQR
jgi:hypothetical protein